jgi:hypothetical protein
VAIIPPKEPATTEYKIFSDVKERRKRARKTPINANVGPIHGPIGVAKLMYVSTLVEKIEKIIAQKTVATDIFFISKVKLLHYPLYFIRKIKY